MKIAILSFYSGHVSRGVENWTHQLAQQLSKNHDVYVLQSEKSSFKKTNYKVKIFPQKVDWKRKDSRGTLKRSFFIDYWSLIILRFTFKFIGFSHKENFDIVIPTNGGWQVIIMRIMCLFFKTKLVTVGHSGPGWDERINLYVFPSVFVALSQKSISWAKKTNPLVKVEYIPNGVDLDIFKQSGKKMELNLERPIYLAVGALESGKRLDLAIEAVARLDKGSLLILGSGELKDKLINKGKELLGDKFGLQAVSYEEIPSYYRTADVFTLPSWQSEAFGLVYLEAMACGLPVVATKDSLRREIIGKAGLLANVEDIDQYSKALAKASTMKWQDEPRRQAEKFSWQKVSQKYESLFKRLINE